MSGEQGTGSRHPTAPCSLLPRRPSNPFSRQVPSPMSDRIFNFGAGPGVLPESVLKEAQRDLWNIAGQRHRHLRAQPSGQGVRQGHQRGRAGLPRPGGDSRQLQGALPAGRSLAPVRDGADEPPPEGRDGGLPGDGRLVGEGGQGGQAFRDRSRGGQRQGFEVHPHPRGDRDQVLDLAGVRAFHQQQHDLRHSMAERAACAGGGAARLRRLERHLQPSHRSCRSTA